MENGLIVSGFSLINERITEKPDFHIHLSVSKKIILKEEKYS